MRKSINGLATLNVLEKGRFKWLQTDADDATSGAIMTPTTDELSVLLGGAKVDWLLGQFRLAKHRQFGAPSRL